VEEPNNVRRLVKNEFTLPKFIDQTTIPCIRRRTIILPFTVLKQNIVDLKLIYSREADWTVAPNTDFYEQKKETPVPL
jgi:hypothetical protein